MQLVMNDFTFISVAVLTGSHCAEFLSHPQQPNISASGAWCLQGLRDGDSRTSLCGRADAPRRFADWRSRGDEHSTARSPENAVSQDQNCRDWRHALRVHAKDLSRRVHVLSFQKYFNWRLTHYFTLFWFGLVIRPYGQIPTTWTISFSITRFHLSSLLCIALDIVAIFANMTFRFCNGLKECLSCVGEWRLWLGSLNQPHSEWLWIASKVIGLLRMLFRMR